MSDQGGAESAENVILTDRKDWEVYRDEDDVPAEKEIARESPRLPRENGYSGRTEGSGCQTREGKKDPDGGLTPEGFLCHYLNEIR